MSEAEERYLGAVDRLAARAGGVTVAALARDLALSKASVSEMLDRLASDALIERGSRGEATLTPAGEEAARALRERRATVESFLRDVLGVSDEDLAGEADRLAGVVSPRLERRMRERLTDGPGASDRPR